MDSGLYFTDSNDKSLPLALGESDENLRCKNLEYKTLAYRHLKFMSGWGRADDDVIKMD